MRERYFIHSVVVVDACPPLNLNTPTKIVLIDEVDKVIYLDKYETLPAEARIIFRFLLDVLEQGTTR